MNSNNIKNYKQFFVFIFLFLIACNKVDIIDPPITPVVYTNSIHWGVNIHDGGNNPQALANELILRNLKYTRMDIWRNNSRYLAKYINVVTIMNAKNIKTKAIVYTVFSNGQARNKDYTANLTEVEQTAYNETKY